ncbi:hypothetical protein GC207_12065 [bacterium]|nr:hypothetical protein [bacterium]
MRNNKTLKSFSDLSFETGFTTGALQAAVPTATEPRPVTRKRSVGENPTLRVRSLWRDVPRFNPAVPGHRWGINE